MAATLPGRRGFTLIEVLLASVVLTIGLLGISAFYSHELDALNPANGQGGLRRYLLAEEMLKANAEGLRATQYIWQDTGKCTLVTPPSGSGFSISDSFPATRVTGTQQYLIHDLTVTQSGSTVAQLTITTLRNFSGGSDVKIGL